MHSNFRLCWFSLFVPACKSPRRIHLQKKADEAEKKAAAAEKTAAAAEKTAEAALPVLGCARKRVKG